MIDCTPVRLSREELFDSLNRHGRWSLGRMLAGFRDITDMELRYVEYTILEYKLYFGENPIRRLRGKTETISRIRVLENGSTGAVSFLGADPETEKREIERRQIQPGMYSPESVENDAKFLCAKVARKMGDGRFYKMELTGQRSIYRPFWVVYYGSARADQKRLCRTFAADGYVVRS